MTLLSTTLAILAGAASVQAAAPYCLAGQKCFPSDKVLSRFNGTVHGNLIKVVPYGAACYAATYNAAGCKTLAEEKEDNAFRLSLPAGVMYTNFELSGTVGCAVPDANANGTAPGPVNAKCTLGNMPAYAVNVSSTKDIATSVKFAAQHNLRFRIKNTGHDYTGRSSGAGALSILTGHLKDTKAIKNFVPQGCNVPPHDVLSADPGVNVEELYQWGADNAQVTIGGFTTTVGATGGYMLGGGIGPLNPHLGMGVDNVLQYEVVTADGVVKIANKCTNQDLFWALLGGGGTFAVTTRVWLKSYPPRAAVNTAIGTITCQDEAAYEGLVDAIVDAQTPLRNLGHTGIWQISKGQLGGTYVSIVAFNNTADVVGASETMKQLDSFANVKGCTPKFSAQQFTGAASFNDAYQGVIWPTLRPYSIIGVNLQDNSRLVSYDIMEDKERLQAVKDYIIGLPADLPLIWQNTVGGVATDVSIDATAVHPEWRTTFAMIDIPNFGPWYGSSAAQNETNADIVKQSEEVFSKAAYYNEHYYQEDWQDAFWGPQYARLLKIKKAVDPKGVFNCPLCVGSEEGY